MLHSQTDNRARELQREYMRAWRSRNKEKIKQYNKRYWERKALVEMEGGKTDDAAPNN